MREVTPRIEAEADQVVERVVGLGRFDVVTELAEYLPMTVVSDLVGLPDHGREKMLEWAAAIWNTQGPADDRAAAAGPPSRSSWRSPTTTPCREDRPDGWAAQLYEAADRGEIPHDKCPVMMLDYVTPAWTRPSSPWPTRSSCSPGTRTSGTCCARTAR
ncbi:hypothetical protein NKH77_51270 [Streptomyces sp. M19]